MIDSITLTDNQRKCIPDVSFELIPIKDLVSNQDYQRELSELHIRKALEEFDVYQLNPVKVSRRDGVNYVFDGQHTAEIVAAASCSRDTPVWCMVYNDLQYREEAHIFADQKKHVKALAPFEIFAAHLEAGDEKQMMINTIVKSYGLTIAKTTQPNTVCAVNTLEKIYDKYGQEILNATLSLAIGTWEGENYSLSGSVLMGLARIITTYGDALDENVFKEQLGKMSVKAIIRAAKERQSGTLGYSEAMMNAYNGKKNKHRLAIRALYEGKKGGKAAYEEYDEIDE